MLILRSLVWEKIRDKSEESTTSAPSAPGTAPTEAEMAMLQTLLRGIKMPGTYAAALAPSFCANDSSKCFFLWA